MISTSMIGVALTNECVSQNVEVVEIVRKESHKTNRIPNSKLIHLVECDINEMNKLEVTKEMQGGKCLLKKKKEIGLGDNQPKKIENLYDRDT